MKHNINVGDLFTLESYYTSHKETYLVYKIEKRKCDEIWYCLYNIATHKKEFKLQDSLVIDELFGLIIKHEI